MAKYPSLSSYNFVANNPILLIDPDGKVIGIKDPKTGETHIYVAGASAPLGASKFVQDTYESLNYLVKNPDAKGVNIVGNLVASEYKVNISQDTRPGGTLFNSNFFQKGIESESDITFNNTASDVFANGKIQSPVVSLAHELDHANKYFSLRKLYNKTKSDAVWDIISDIFASDKDAPAVKKEEQRALKGYESHIAKKLKQFIRTNYYDKTQNPKGTVPTNDVIKGTPTESSSPTPSPAPTPSTGGDNCEDSCE